jgi:glycosyltransferase involved in cell wall biosynthesis
MAAQHIPTVSIGLAVYNGERYLEEAIESILCQTFTDFEMIISDNASTDNTDAICRAFASRDARIRYSRNAENIGGANNENLTFRLARGRYFRLAAHDDRCAPTLIERCVEVLENSPEVVLCHSGTIAIDECGVEHEIIYRSEGTEEDPVDRFRSLSSRDHWCEATYGLIRSNALARTQLQRNYTNSDRVLLCELALHGRFHLLAEPLFYKRYHPGNEYKDWRGRMAWFNPQLAVTGRSTFPNWLEFTDYFRVAARSPISYFEKSRCMSATLRWALRYRRDLLGDITSAIRHSFRPKNARVTRYSAEESWR